MVHMKAIFFPAHIYMYITQYRGETFSKTCFHPACSTLTQLLSVSHRPEGFLSIDTLPLIEYTVH